MPNPCISLLVKTPGVLPRVLLGLGLGLKKHVYEQLRTRVSGCVGARWACIGFHWLLLAIVGLRWLSWACIGFCWPAWLLWACTGLRWPALAFIGLHWPALADDDASLASSVSSLSPHSDLDMFPGEPVEDEDDNNFYDR